jgi:hypothetical protein
MNAGAARLSNSSATRNRFDKLIKPPLPDLQARAWRRAFLRQAYTSKLNDRSDNTLGYPVIVNNDHHDR